MMPDLQPVLKGELLILRPLKEEDRESLYAVASDPLIWDQHPCNDRHQPPVFDAFFDRLIKSQSSFLALDAKEGRVLGATRYYDWDPVAKSIIIGSTFLSRAAWGRGYNREMKKLLIDHAFRFADNVCFHVSKSNQRSQRAMKNIGGEVAAELDVMLPNGSTCPILFIALQKRKASMLKTAMPHLLRHPWTPEQVRRGEYFTQSETSATS